MSVPWRRPAPYATLPTMSDARQPSCSLSYAWLSVSAISRPSPVDDLLELRQRLRLAIDQKMPLRLQELAVNGDDLQHLGITPGPRLGQILQTLLDHVLDDPAENTRTRLLALAQAERDLPQHSGTG